MIRPEVVPLIVVALLLIAAQPGVETVTTVVGGDQALPDGADAVVVVDGTVTVPEGVEAPVSVYLVGGTVRIAGTLDGELVQLAGTVDVGSSGVVTGQYQQFGGELARAGGATIEPEVVAEPLTRERSPGVSAGLFVLQLVALFAVSYVIGGRFPDLLENVADAARRHPVVSGTVGLLSAVTMIALFVFMAFTIILIPISVLGLVVGLLVLGYAYVAVGYLIGRVIPTDSPGLATALGALGFSVASRLFGFVPIVGDSVPVVVLIVGLGAVLITYFGLQAFETPTLGPVE
ncbi:MAG: hypothetical protein R3324_04800 [Halobacteriales archaeon]|nr:hypothetical protein [Halobacteriales archaeon]